MFRMAVLVFTFVISLFFSQAFAQEPTIVGTLAFTEGPTVDRNLNVYFTEIVTQRIMKLGPDGVLTTFRENSNVANGLLMDQDRKSVV